MKHQTLVIFSSTDGHTQKISEVIVDTINKKNKTISRCVSLNEVQTKDLQQANSIILGASIRYGKFQPKLYEFIQKHQTLLEQKENGFFCVNAVARKPEKNTPLTNPYMQKFLQQISWQPKTMEVFAGKLDYPRYRFIDKHMIRFIMWLTKGPTDTTQSFEFTNWTQVAVFSQRIEAMVTQSTSSKTT